MNAQAWLDEVAWNADGLVPAVAQDAASGEVLMVAWMSRESLARTVESGEATYWSRSRKALWRKGESSGHVQKVREVRLDCDADAVLLTEGNAHHRHDFDLVVVFVLQQPAAFRAEFAFDIETKFRLDIAAQFRRNQMEWFLVHRAFFDGIDRACLAARIIFQPALEQADDSGLTTADRPHQQQDALAHLKPLRRRPEVFHDLLQRFFDAEDLFAEELVLRLTEAIRLSSAVHNHRIDALV